MNSWREKVADKLSSLLADSPSSSSPLVRRDSPAVRPERQAVLLSAEEAHSPKPSQLSSYLVSFLQTSGTTVHKDSSNRRTGWRGHILQLPSLSGRWASKNLSLNDEPTLPLDLDDKSTHTSANTGNGNGNDKVGIDNDNLVLFDPRSDEISIRIEETSTSQSMEHFSSFLMDESTFICFNLFEFFQSSLPNIVKGRQWILLYSTLKHGISLRTLLRKSADLPGPCLLIVGDKQGAIFGGLLDGPLKPTAKRKYQGTNQTFLFTTIYGAPRLFRATGANRYYYLCLSDLLAFGGGGNFALCLDGDLLHGTSGPSETFGNLCLAHSPEFELKNVELWGFAHISQYLK